MILGVIVGFFLFRFLHATAADVENANTGEEEYFFADFSETLAEVGVFVVEEKSLIESVHEEEIASWNSKGCATCPADNFRFLGFSE